MVRSKAPILNHSARNCFVPMVDGSSLNDCLTANGDCGKSAADAFCETGGQIKFHMQGAATHG